MLRFMYFFSNIYALIFLTKQVVSTAAIDNQCYGRIAETIPPGLEFASVINTTSTFDELLHLFTDAKQTIDIASFYWTLSASEEAPEPGDNSTLKGQAILDALIDAKNSRNVTTRIAVDKDRDSTRKDSRIKSTDLHLLRPVAEIRELNFTRLVGGGVLHTKFIVVDGKNVYLGSANMDWRSITHVKELGAVITNCTQLTDDLLKLFEIYWYLGQENVTVPTTWPQQYTTAYNSSNPLVLTINDTTEYGVYLSVEPKAFCADGRTQELDSILSVIDNARQFIYISVMDYYPLSVYGNLKYWPVIDDALRKAAVDNRVSVRMLVSRWPSSRNFQSIFLKSLNALNSSTIYGNVEVKLFVVPSFTEQQQSIPYARVNHNKFMVTDRSVYISTSNWAQSYFTDTAGVAVIMTPNVTNANQSMDLRSQVQSIFIRDWFSSYSHFLEEFDQTTTPSTVPSTVALTTVEDEVTTSNSNKLFYSNNLMNMIYYLLIIFIIFQ